MVNYIELKKYDTMLDQIYKQWMPFLSNYLVSIVLYNILACFKHTLSDKKREETLNRSCLTSFSCLERMLHCNYIIHGVIT